MFSLNLENYHWSMLKVKAKDGDDTNLPKTRDEHSSVVYDDSMIVFGGFVFGERTNELFKFTFETNTWEKIIPEGKACPCPRVGHSAIVWLDEEEGDKLIIFGGKDDENNKLADTWKFNFRTNTWTEC